MAHISPSKTLEGVIGGLVAAAVVGAVLVAALGRPWLAGLGFGLVLAAPRRRATSPSPCSSARPARRSPAR